MTCEYSTKNYSILEKQNEIYAFEIKITYFDNRTIKHRVIIKETNGELFKK